MLGEDTLFFTRKGFKKLKNLNKYDEILTGFGTFAHITELGPREKMTKCVEFTTGEKIYCTDDMLWNVGSDRGYKYTDELELLEDGATCADISEFQGVRGRKSFGNYRKSVVVPRCVPNECLLADRDAKLEFLAGLIDSPICEIGDSDGIYVFYTFSDELAHGIISLARSLNFGVTGKKSGLVHIIRVYINKYIDILPVRDDYKACYDYANTVFALRVKNVREIRPDEACFGRSVRVNGGFGLIGYSFIPIA